MPVAKVRAVVQDAYGGPETWRTDQIPERSPGRAEIRVRVAHAAIDHGTRHLMRGTPLMARPAFGLRRPRNRVPGRDFAGTVDAVGADVSDLAVGDRVIGIAPGSLATSTIASRRKVVAVPRGLTGPGLAALGISGLTALQAVDAARVSAGHRVLVIGASGGVGHFVVQLCALRRAQVTAVCSAAKADAVRGWGAATVLDRHTTDPSDLPERFDAVIDIAGGRSLAEQRRLLRPRGTIVFVGDNTGGRFSGGYLRPIGSAIRMLASSQRFVMLASRESGADLERLIRHVARDEIAPHVDDVVAFDDAPEAMRRLESGEVTGKIVVAVGTLSDA